MNNRKRVVITGMGILSPLADNIAEFRQALFNKQCAISDSQRFSRWFANARAAEVQGPGDYPGLSDEIINSLDNAALWAYKVGKDALTQAGLINHQASLDETGLIIGVSSAGTEAFLPLFERRMQDFSLAKAIFSGGFSSCCASVSSLLRLKGGVELVATACTASPNAIGMAFDYIQNGKSQIMLAAGTEPIYLPTFAGFYALNVMHPESCTPFSGTPGMSIGEGAGALVLEEYQHAVDRGATLYAEILSYATSCDAWHETGPDPRANGAVQVMIKALHNADIAPDRVDYVNLHGTGTEANDRIETLAVKKVFPHSASLPVSSTKSWFGHTIGAAGMVELIACLVTLPEKKILPTLNFGTPRVNCDLDYVANDFREQEVNIFVKNNYAFGGNNCSLVVSTQPASVPVTAYQEKRVAISGIGAITALGHTLNEMLEAIWSYQKPVALQPVVFHQDTLAEVRELLEVLRATRQFETVLGYSLPDVTPLLPEQTENFKTFQVTGLEPRQHLRRYDRRKATRGGTFALIALSAALTSARRKIRKDGDEIGLIMGMSRGSQETTWKYLQSLQPDPCKVRTSEFPGSLMNAIATFCGISEGIKGYTTTLATGENAALGALTYGYEIIRQNLQSQVIVGGADEYFPSMALYMDAVTQKLHMTADARDYQIYGNASSGFVPGEGACMLLLEAPETAEARGAAVLAEIVGYGKSCSNGYFAAEQLSENAQALTLAIDRALTDAGITAKDIDLVCGSSNGSQQHSHVEIDAIWQSFQYEKPQVPVVNYNAFFGFVASSAGLLNLAVLVDCFRQQRVPAIPHTQLFCDDRLNFVREPLNIPIKLALLLGANESGNYYALVIKG
ncbi:beta-ketoacyl-ACP synthase [Mixta theicola]|uniref:Beta-ketoacyl-ACP synthase n=1 Tax=Mixta theicola TaxID=1458355 RepID=A0A2K1QEH7_9GAMM|nr:beta-ketoacyl-[acyl-carrier-protein] synthase family protein [Mixta theicola]PNS13433.1 beta-ketoacyl-ACP synthase [Mixta theicola]GLR09748.1 beta-ketoacyl-ACP synthase [Mixta theicola]